MMVSDTYRFAVFHAPRTGGSTLAHALAPYLRTPVSPLLDDNCRGWQGKHHLGGHHTHRPISHYEPLIKTLWAAGYTVVAGVRSPLSKAVCQWWYGAHILAGERTWGVINHRPRMSFAEFWLGWPWPQLVDFAVFKPQAFWLDDLSLVDVLYDFENFESEVEEIFTRELGVPSLELPHRMSRQDGRHWTSYYRDHRGVDAIIERHFDGDFTLYSEVER